MRFLRTGDDNCQLLSYPCHIQLLICANVGVGLDWCLLLQILGRLRMSLYLVLLIVDKRALNHTPLLFSYAPDPDAEGNVNYHEHNCLVFNLKVECEENPDADEGEVDLCKKW